MDVKLDKLTKRVHATEEGISNTEEREAETKRSMNWNRVLIFNVEQSRKIRNRSHCALSEIESIELDVMLFVQILFDYLFEHNKKTSSHSLKGQI